MLQVKGELSSSNKHNKHKMYYINKKVKNNMLLSNECIYIHDSLAQDPNRESSTLVHLTKGSNICIGRTLNEIMKTTFEKKSIRNMKVLDVGHEHGNFLAMLNQVFKTKCVGIEVCPMTCKGSVLMMELIYRVSHSVIVTLLNQIYINSLLHLIF